MVKLPVAGRVKTRLARDIGVAEATRFYRVTAGNIIRRLTSQPFWTTYLAVSPDTGVSSRMLPPSCVRISQGNGDLAARMHRPMRHLPPGPVCVVGTDIPAIIPRDIRTAFRALDRHDAVLGPAEDGGFWLIGFRRRPRVVYPYAGVLWSRDDTRVAVEANLAAMSVAHTQCHSDVDSGADLAQFSSRLGRLIPPR